MTIIKSLLFTLCLFPVAQAEIITDGSLGARVELPGKDFQITPELGQQFGGNLFHSFQNFNLSEGETATFSGANSVQNVIARVTGGSPSLIDGTLRSTIPNADLYFLNPYGIMFGLHAKLDLQGGFHVSTADYLRLQDGGRFEARTPSNSLLTVAPVTAFGFLTDSPAAITTQDSRLAIPNGKTLSLIGGTLELNGSSSPVYTYDEPISDSRLNLESRSWLLAESGHLNLSSIKSLGEILFINLIPELSVQGGMIAIKNTALATYYMDGGGSIFIRGGNIVINNSVLDSMTFERRGGVTDIQADNLFLKSSVIDQAAYGTGAGGSIRLKIAGELNLTGEDNEEFCTCVYTSSHSTLPNAGDAGTVTVQARQIHLEHGGQIVSGTVGYGHGGAVNLKVQDTLFINGDRQGIATSGVFASSQNNQISNAGDAGHITIEAEQTILSNGGKISSSTYGVGQGGNLLLQSDKINISGQNSNGVSSGIYAGALNLEEVIKGSKPLKEGLVQGNAGYLTIRSNIINLVDDGKISTQANQAAGGDIIISTDFLYLHKGQLITSVFGGLGNGGNVTVANSKFIVLNQGNIKAQADAGRGGNIAITAEHFIPSVESLVSASSNLGIDGQITINSPTEDVGNQVLSLSANYLNAASLFPRSCAARIADQRPSEFVRPFTLTVKSKVISAAPEDLRASHIQ